VNYRGRQIDVVRLWERYVEFPPNFKADDDAFLPLVVCPNPNHDTLKRHFQINQQDGLVHCFARCGISGTFEHAIALLEGLYDKFNVSEAGNERERNARTARARRQARKIILGNSKGVSSSDEIIFRVKARSASGSTKSVAPLLIDYERHLPPVAIEYLKERKISSGSVAKWELGWLPDEKRIVIPVLDENQHLRLIIKRAVFARQSPKYLYFPEKTESGWGKTDLLFGAGQIDLEMVKFHGLVLVEGSIDAIRFHQHGLSNTVAILGTGISEAQRRIIARIKPKKVFLFFDKDAAGIHNIEIAAKALRKYPLFVCRYPKEKSDPAELTKREAYRQIDRSIPVFRFLNSLGLSGQHQRKGISLGTKNKDN
jgi:DNA primase